MKKTKLLVCLLALTTIAAGALAEHTGFSLGLGVQYWDAKDADLLDEDGLAGGGLILRYCPVEYAGIDLRVGGAGVWDGKKWREDGVKYEADATFYCVPVEAGLILKIPLGDALTLYGGPGVGYYYYDIDVELHSRKGHHYHSEYSEHIKLEDDFGWYAVAGLTINLAPNVAIFGEGRYTDSETKLKHSDGGEFDASGFGAMAGLMFNF